MYEKKITKKCFFLPSCCCQFLDPAHPLNICAHIFPLFNFLDFFKVDGTLVWFKKNTPILWIFVQLSFRRASHCCWEFSSQSSQHCLDHYHKSLLNIWTRVKCCFIETYLKCCLFVSKILLERSMLWQRLF